MAVIEGIGDEVLIYGTSFVVFGAIVWWRFFTDPTQYDASSQVQESNQGPSRVYNSDTCPICLSPPRLAVETSCGHKFCGSCIRTYLDNRGSGDSLFSGGVPCPMCRQKVNLLLVSFARDSATDDEERRQVEYCVYEFNVRFGNGPRTLMTYIRDCPILIRHLIANFFCYEGIMWVFRLRVIFCLFGAVLYFVLPLDIIPEEMFGIFGLIDDVLIIYLCAIYLSIIYRHAIVNYNANPSEDT